MKVSHRHDERALPDELLDDPRIVEIAAWGNKLATAGLSPEASGNMSCRTDQGFLITATGVPLGAITPPDWVLVSAVDVDPDGVVVVTSRGPHEPSRDAAVHHTLYEQQSLANTVFHLHVGHLDELRDRLGVPSTDVYYPAGTKESMDEIARFLEGRPDTRYFLLIDHGIVAWGESVAETAALVEARQRELGARG